MFSYASFHHVFLISKNVRTFLFILGTSLSLSLSPDRFCLMGASTWSLQNIQLPLEKLCQSKWCTETLCIHGHGNAWVYTCRNSGQKTILLLIFKEIISSNIVTPGVFIERSTEITALSTIQEIFFEMYIFQTYLFYSFCQTSFFSKQ